MSAIADRLAPAAAVLPARQTSVLAGLRLEMRLVGGPEWDRTIAEFDEVCQEQLHVFATARWPAVEQEPVLFLADGEVVGGSLMMVQRLPLGIAKIAVSKWGPMLKDAAVANAAAIRAGMIEALIAEYAVRRGLMLSVLPRASLTPGNPEYANLITRGFQRGSELGFPSRYIVNLRLSDAEQRKSFAQKWRYHLNKSERSGLTFEHAGPERMGEFDALYAAMTDRKKFTDHSAYDTVQQLMATEVEALRPELFFVRHEGEVVAGALIFKAGDRAVYLYGATSDKALPLRAGYFIHAKVISWLRDNTKAKWYDLGGTDGFHGLHQFKKGMVGEAGIITPVPPVANYASRPLPYLFGTAAFWGRDVIHRSRAKLKGLLQPKARPDQAPIAPDASAP
ncbi:MAG: family N-acetyltransferase [Devosia sp.]|uniref:lipid II:glycine glycyltransferase FemX n=1 Tax=Devosia sp. TaxID=1871048 RepID=UPI00260ED6AB|nr:GNAT family N-acetyltransferase [Devosia sp.]MDB5527776.1 family N-acetyltransferase [Devosia sp.]